ncbi:replication protein A 14 kDa subunit isoform X2 [Phoenix dactylifera]|uniref:Replication protein A 14 kDa subunit isoform X2 n=1 Tax=Phoenix dactylifera TaxID=42345 RepID=A0A8B9ASC6_PHODC|nr:replication protein A 14 kDa subunit isoform X2 [Phoenix dactylifera]
MPPGGSDGRPARRTTKRRQNGRKIKKTKAFCIKIPTRISRRQIPNPKSIKTPCLSLLPIATRGFRPICTIMDTSSPAVFVNAELLKMYQGRRVRAVVQVMRNEGGVIIGKSTDGHQLTVKVSQAFPLSHFVEVIDTLAYNGLCQLANGKFKNLFL